MSWAIYSVFFINFPVILGESGQVSLSYFSPVSYGESNEGQNRLHQKPIKKVNYFLTQVNVSIYDVNDNAPEFDVGTVKISVRENAVLNEAIYAAHATDHDSGANGIVTYSLVQNPGNMFLIDEVGSTCR